ncbi:MAG: hypothetical protein ACD_16C00059G0019 [uncultured bacterium]|nr:MAG: hypothetical protein ACD_16C00059G0019 [uncultured bacterium]OFW69735.1 MAG: hypothetical protein A2X70_01595 [Alphaproteobacteria bacterium GWC2_42_16]OFW84544.1 MAG: hypothetical protein A3E50_07840 [Alphaproteobacteria bacterium RIFCSPHIGHO2_12_FULL_42_100]OFW85521.1 MAG: hypothetical protein A2W06_02050 [Alphaproteobacteria bacterium RBG_16_42_14]OFW91374.1 MAG: hypothetical protein A2W46_02830 [Alphaproteobacteria bacterium RIFCSPHIGHO2_12_42_13]OFW92410.1 MAG: hypothetical protei
MKIFSITITTLGLFYLSSPLDANISSCQNSCYRAKANCNSLKSHTFNTCDHDLFTCKASCNSGKPGEVYGGSSLEISFNPILNLEP